jgi:hypothetical protein
MHFSSSRSVCVPLDGKEASKQEGQQVGDGDQASRVADPVGDVYPARS